MAKKADKKIELGNEVRDKVTGFRGIAIARTMWLNSCSRITIQPPLDKDKKMTEANTFDEPQLEYIGEGTYKPPVFETPEARTGGPCSNPTRARTPKR